MIAWLLYFREQALYNRKYIQFYMEEGAKLGIAVRLILIEDLEFGVKNNHWFMTYQNEVAEYPDFAVCRAIYPILNRQLECMGIRVFNNSFVAEICNDKARTCQYLAGTGIRMVDTSFYRNFQIGDAISSAEGMTVIKAVDGHGGSQVFLINNEEAKITGNFNKEIPDHELNFNRNGKAIDNKPADKDTAKLLNNKETERIKQQQKIIAGLGSSDVVVQPFTGRRHQDLRVYVIGKEIVAAVLRTAKEGFRSNFSLGGEVRLYELSEEEKKIVALITGQFEFGLVGIDFIIGDEGELIFNEIEDVVGSRMLYQCSDINIVELYLKYIIKQIKK